MSDDPLADVTPELWQRIAPMLDTALSLPLDEQSAFIARSCSGDAALQVLLDRLLVNARTGGDMLDSPAAIAFSALMPRDEPAPEVIAARYQIRDVLGRGGAATVYRAYDPRTEREVAIKVLHPHLASSLGRDRFLREVRIAAKMSHPAIVPLFDAGEADGLVYYVMPLVAGRSLRERLRRDGVLPQSDAVRILAQVTSAIAFAHAQGIVHRDIKPDNVLLSADDQALVADFGIAKALSVAADARSDARTTVGIAIGTPAYMAPEQVSADPLMDARVDIYAFGAMAYELITGSPPFHDRSATAIATAHLIESPVPISMLTPSIDPALASLVMRCLEKQRDARPTAVEVMDGLALASTMFASTAAKPQSVTGAPIAASESVSGEARGAWRWRVGLATAVVVAAIWAWVRMPNSAPRAAAHGSIARTPIVLATFDAPGGDEILATAFSDVVRAAFAQSRTLVALSDRRVAAALRRMGQSPDGRVSVSTAREIGVREGIGAVLRGGISGDEQKGYLVSLTVLSADSGRVVATAQRPARSISELIVAVDTMVRALRSSLGEDSAGVRGTPPLATVSTSSLPALRKFAEARLLMARGGGGPAPAALLTEAIALDTSFAVAYMLLARAYGPSAPRSLFAPALSAAYQRRNRLEPAEAALVSAQFFHFGVGQDLRAAERFYGEAMTYGDTVDAREGLARLRVQRRDWAGAATLLATSAQRDSLSADETAVLVLSLGMLGRFDEAQGRLDAAIRHGLLSEELLAKSVELPWWQGRYADAEAAARDMAKSRVPPVHFTGVAFLSQVAIARGQFRLADSLNVVMLATSGAPPLPPAHVLRNAAFEAQVYALVQDNREKAFALIEKSRREVPLESLTELDRPYVQLAEAYAFAGRPQQALDMVRRITQLRDSQYRSSMAPVLPQLWQEVAIAANQPDSALRLLRSEAMSGTSDPRLIFWQERMGRAYFAAARYDSAARYLEAYRSTPDPSRIYAFADPLHLAPVLWRLGESHEALGNRPKAIGAYEQLLRLWASGDSVAPRAAVIRARVARLRAIAER